MQSLNFYATIQVLNEANLTNAVLARTVLTRSDLGGALIEGADFSDAVLDLPQKQVFIVYNWLNFVSICIIVVRIVIQFGTRYFFFLDFKILNNVT